MNVNEIGLKFNRLTVIKEVEPYILPCGQKNKAYLCVCDCGVEKVVRRLHLVRGKIKSCGCITRGPKDVKGDGNSLLKKVWRQMKTRCSKDYFQKHLYFEKGISVCSDWYNDFNLFKKWALENGYSKGLVIDRSDNSKGYNPENCRWVTQLVNSMNKDNSFLVSYNGEIKPLMLILTEKKMRQNIAAIRARINRGWDHQKAIDTPIKKGNYFKTRNELDIKKENEKMFSRL